MATDRSAEVTWKGDLVKGSGTIDSTTSGVLNAQSVTWPARSENPMSGRTSPEELIAAAHAACFSMALTFALSKAERPAEELKTLATVTFQPGEGITKIALVVEGRVPGLDAAAFDEIARGAKQNCTVSKALAGVPEITLEARLAA